MASTRSARLDSQAAQSHRNRIAITVAERVEEQEPAEREKTDIPILPQAGMNTDNSVKGALDRCTGSAGLVR